MSLDTKLTTGSQRADQRRQRGFSIVSAIFLLVVLSALGAFMLTFSTIQQTTSAQDLQGSKAYQAARAGMDWGAYQILRNSGAAYATGCRGALTTQVLPALGGTLAPFSVTVDCTARQYQEGANTVWIYQVTSTAIAGVLGQTNYVSRQLQAAIGQ